MVHAVHGLARIPRTQLLVVVRKRDSWQDSWGVDAYAAYMIDMGML
jgi:hypothetical protein